MAKTTMRDMVIILPGITGSVLAKDDKDIWAISGQAVWSGLSTWGKSLQDLKLLGDDPLLDDLDDGIHATCLISDVHLIPGLHKIDGYSTIARLITDHFNVIPGTLNDNKPANFFLFPYDWRRDNRVAARKLQVLIEQRLPQWREYSGAADAKVILLAHSMGGIIARYYTEVLEGWPNCRAVFTFGTPHRGSVKALNFLSNGYKKLFLDLTEVMRSFTSIYQLLPIYEMLKVEENYRRVAEVDSIPGVDRERAIQALAFHREIETAVERHWQNMTYRDEYKVIPIVGTRQPTWQSAALLNQKITPYRYLPTWIGDPSLGDGDGTVPRLSATPIELSFEYRDTYIEERHSSLQSHGRALQDMLQRLKDMQSPLRKAIRGPEIKPDAASRPAISLDLDDLYLADEPIELRAELINQGQDSGGLQAQVESIGGIQVNRAYTFTPSENEWLLNLPDLPPGLYRVTVQTQRSGPGTPTPVHDIFEIAS